MDRLELEALLVPRRVHVRAVQRLGGVRVGFVALGPREMLEQTVASQDYADGVPDGLDAHLASPDVRRRVVLRSCVTEDGAGPFFESARDVLDLPVDVLDELYDHAVEVDRGHRLTDEHVTELLKIQLPYLELLRVRRAQELSAYWGAPARQLSDAQVLYFVNAWQQVAQKVEKNGGR